jgi:ribosomal protein S18 acetylase RimI-like enzyme
MIKTRNLTIGDFDGLIKLLQQLWVDKEINKEAVRTVIEKGLHSENQKYICAIDGEKLVGYCSLTIKNNLWVSANLGNVDELVVDSQYRNKGIGKLLLNKIEAIARQHKCVKIELDSAFHRTAAHEFYERLGFKKRAYLFIKDL